MRTRPGLPDEPRHHMDRVRYDHLSCVRLSNQIPYYILVSIPSLHQPLSTSRAVDPLLTATGLIYTPLVCSQHLSVYNLSASYSLCPSILSVRPIVSTTPLLRL